MKPIKVIRVASIWLTQMLLLTLPFTGTSYATGSFAGGGAGNGREIFTSAWFPEKDRIQWCIKGSNHLGVPTPKVISTIKKAFATWNHYLDAKGLQDNLPSLANPNRLRPRLFAYEEFQEECSADTDLTFFLAENAEMVEAVKSRYYDTAIAFSHLTSYDLRSASGQGFIWMRAAQVNGDIDINWADNRNLMGLLLHELGHVIGCDHVDGTIMHANIATTTMRGHEVPATPEMFGAGRYSIDFLDKIDFQRELYFLPALHHFAVSTAESNPDHNSAFRLLKGVRPIGESAIMLRQRRYSFNAELIAIDQLGVGGRIVNSNRFAMRDFSGPAPNDARLSDSRVFSVLSSNGFEYYFPPVMNNIGNIELDQETRPMRWRRNHAFDGTQSEITIMAADFSEIRLFVSNINTIDKLHLEPFKSLIEESFVPRFD